MKDKKEKVEIIHPKFELISQNFKSEMTINELVLIWRFIIWRGMIVTNSIQKEHLEVLKAIDEICKKENLSYMLYGGTLLGAVREKGFIEWDDDADIMMHRRDFDALEGYCNKYLDVYGLFLNNNHWIPRVVPIHNHEINVEIILIDSLPRNKLLRKFKLMMLKLLQGMLKTTKDFSRYSTRDKLIGIVMWHLGRIIKPKAILNFYKRVSKLGNSEDSELIFFSNERYKYLIWELKRKFLAEKQRICFEDTELLVPKEWDAFLKLFYGNDYMIPKRENYYI